MFSAAIEVRSKQKKRKRASYEDSSENIVRGGTDKIDDPNCSSFGFRSASHPIGEGGMSHTTDCMARSAGHVLNWTDLVIRHIQEMKWEEIGVEKTDIVSDVPKKLYRMTNPNELIEKITSE